MSLDKNALPDVAFQKLVAGVGTPGAGKSYNICGQIAIPVLKRGGQLITIDPTGAWFGLALKPDGKTPSGLNIAVFGGDHGVMPLTPNMGRAMGELLGREPLSAILDLSAFEPDEQIHFVSEFAKIFLVANKKPVTVIIDEADEFMPQSPHLKGESAVCRGRLKRFVTRGRKRGVRPVILTQRPQEIDKGVLNHSQVLIAFQCIGEHERKAINGYVGANGDPETVSGMLKELSELEVGEAWVWAPRKPKFLARMKFGRIGVYDSFKEEDEAGGFSGTVALSAVKLEGIQKALAAQVEEQKANDPAHLRAEIAKLKRELAAKPATTPAAAAKVDTKAIREAAFNQGVAAERKAHGKFRADLRKLVAAIPRTPLEKLTGLVATIDRALELEPSPGPAPTLPPEATARREAPPVPVRAPRPAAETPPAPVGDLNTQELKVLRALSELEHMRVTAPRIEQIAILAGYHPNTGKFRDAVRSLKARGMIDEEHVVRGANPCAVEAPLTEDEIHARMLAVMYEEPERRSFEALYAAPDGGLTVEELAETAQYHPNTGKFRDAIRKMKNLNMIEMKPGNRMQLKEWVYGR